MIKGYHLPATLLALTIVGIGIASLTSLLLNAPDISHSTLLWHDIWALVRFSLWQAFCSMVLSVSAALMVVLAVLFFAQFPMFQRRILPPWLALNSLLIVLPTTVAAQGLLLVWGRDGLLTPLREAFDLELFGLDGIIIAHMLLNIPFAFRVLLARLHSLPTTHRQLMLLVGAPLWWRFRVLYWPHLLPSLRQASAVVFLLCFTSFSLVLIFGGGPANNTLEVAIYTAVRFELDFDRAALLSLTQWVLCIGLLWWSHHKPVTPALAVNSAINLITPGNRYQHPLQFLSASTILAIAGLFLIPPVVMVVNRGLNSAFWSWLTKPVFWQSVSYSLGLAIGSGLLALLLAFVLAYASLFASARLTRLYHQASSLFLMVPTVTFATGIFLLLRPLLFGDTGNAWIAPSVLLVGNALFCLPFVYRLILPALEQQQKRYATICALWSGHVIARLWYGYILGLSHQWRLGFALASTLSLGELGLIALLHNQQFTTLPWLVYQSINRFQLAEASALSLWLLLLIVILYAMSETGRSKKKRDHG